MDRDAAVEAREGEAGYGPPSDTAGPGRGTTVATGHHRFVQGDFDILVLSDGFITVPGDVVLPDASAAQRASLLGRLDTVDGAVRSKTNIPVLSPRRRGDPSTSVPARNTSRPTAGWAPISRVPASRRRT